MATVASVKRSERGNNLVDPYTEEEVDARYRLMLKPGEVESILSWPPFRLVQNTSGASKLGRRCCPLFFLEALSDGRFETISRGLHSVAGELDPRLKFR